MIDLHDNVFSHKNQVISHNFMSRTLNYLYHAVPSQTCDSSLVAISLRCSSLTLTRESYCCVSLNIVATRLRATHFAMSVFAQHSRTLLHHQLNLWAKAVSASYTHNERLLSMNTPAEVDGRGYQVDE